MKPIEDAKIEAFEDMALESVKQLRAFFTYQGTDAKYFQKARLAAAMISSYARIRASETNRMAVELTANNQLEAATARPRLAASK